MKTESLILSISSASSFFRRHGLLAVLLLALSVPAFGFVDQAVSKRIQGIDVVTGKTTDLPFRKAGKATVVVFLSVNCPCSKGHEKALAKIYQEFQGPEFQFIGVHSNADESYENTVAHFKEAQMPFPVIQDQGAQIAEELLALKTPHAYVIDPEGKILYQGGVDDSHQAVTARENYLENTLTLIRKNQPVLKSNVRVLGCAIKRP